MALDCGFRRNDDVGDMIWPPVVPLLVRGDVDSRLRGNDGVRKGLLARA